MSLETRLVALVNAIGADIKNLLTTRGTMSALSTTDKTSLVAALNEVRGLIGGGGATINDSAQNGTQTWSSNKIQTQVNAAITALVAGAPTAFDTLIELSNELSNQSSATSNLLTAVGNRIRFDAAQSLTAPQQSQACANIGVGNPEIDLTATYTTAKT